jgi:hypothetical protein
LPLLAEGTGASAALVLLYRGQGEARARSITRMDGSSDDHLIVLYGVRRPREGANVQTRFVFHPLPPQHER